MNMRAELPKAIQTPNAARVAIRQFCRISDLWGLSKRERQQVLAVSASTLRRYESGAFKRGLRPQTLERLSLVFNIYEVTRILMTDAAIAHSWPRRGNDAYGFHGHSAIDVMIENPDGLKRLWAYLDSQVLK